jgi:hypothetical protein
MAFDADSCTILQAVILGVGIEDDVVVFYAVSEARVAALARS